MAEDWPEPMVTPNAMLLSGYIGGALMAHKDRLYQVVEADPPSGNMIVVRRGVGSRFRVHVEQIGGTE